jgi:hypothetical protein
MIAAAAPLRGLYAGILLTCTNNPTITNYRCRSWRLRLPAANRSFKF